MPEKVGIRIGGRDFAYWSSVAITLGLDTVDTISLSAPFEASRREFRQTFRPLSFSPIEATIGNVALFTGTMIEALPNVTPDASTVDVSGYSLPGVLGDCDEPVSELPLEWKGAGLRTIAERVCTPFGLTVDYELDDDRPFELVALDPLKQRKSSRNKEAIQEEGKPWEFLVKLAQQRGGLLASSSLGHLRLWKAIQGTAIAQIEGGLPPLVSVSPQFRPQEYYSEITGFAPTTRRKKGSKFTVQNERLTSVVRPHSFSCDDSEDADAPEATEAKLGRMFANAVSYTIEGLPGWRDPRGHIWTPNQTIRLMAPNAMIYRATDFLIRTVTLRQDSDSETTDLNVVFPGAYTGEAPTEFPWDE